MIPEYDLDKIKFTTDSSTFNKAIDLYERGCITQFTTQLKGYSALVLGGNPYRVLISADDYAKGACECYLGENDTLCKHMVAVAIYAVKGGETLTNEDRLQRNQLTFSGLKRDLTEKEYTELRRELTNLLRYIKPYRGPSRIWFSYQNSLEEGCNRLSATLSTLPVSRQTSKIVVALLLRLDKRLTTSGVDDSNGTVGSFMEELVDLLQEFAKMDQECTKEFEAVKNRETCFGWEKPLLTLMDNAN